MYFVFSVKSHWEFNMPHYLNLKFRCITSFGGHKSTVMDHSSHTFHYISKVRAKMKHF